MPSPPFTDPWLPAAVDGVVPAIRSAIVFEVYRITGSTGDYTYTLLPNVVCLAIEEHEGPAPASAKFRYRFAGDDATGPQSIEEALSTSFSGAHVVAEGDRLGVWGIKPSGVGAWIFDGYALKWDLHLDSKSELCAIDAVGVAKICWDTPIGGMLVRNSQDPGSVDDVPTDLPAQFNPGGIPNASPASSDSGSGVLTYPVFMDPNVKGTDTDGSAYPREWDLAMAVAHLIYANDPGAMIGTPVRSALNDLLVSRVPNGDNNFDPNDPATYDVVPIQVPDAPLTGRNWPNVVHELIQNSGFGMCFKQATTAEEDPRTDLDLWLKQSRTAKPILLPARGSVFDPQWCNLSAASLSRDLAPVVNRWVVRGALDRYEVSFVLAPGFPSAAGDAATLGLYDKSAVGFDTSDAYNTYRLFLFDESGEGHYSNTSSTKITVPTSLDAVLGTPDDQGKHQYTTRRRPPIGQLFSVDSMGKPLHARVAVSTDYTGDKPGIWDGTGNWHPVTGGFRLLHDQIGIYLTDKHPNGWGIGKSEDTNAPFKDGKVQVVECLATPGGATPQFWIRLTCVIEADHGLLAVAVPSEGSPVTRAITREVDARDRYRVEKTHGKSEFNSTTDKLTIRDDTIAANAEAVALRTASEAGVFEGQVVIPRFTTYYEIGDRISSIQGRDLSLRTNAPGQAAVYPVVVGRRWDLAGTQHTILTLSDAGLARKRYAPRQPRTAGPTVARARR